jgi:hypothetical protein
MDRSVNLAAAAPSSPAEAIEQKFHLAAALKAEHALHDWALTATAGHTRGGCTLDRLSLIMITSGPTSRSGVHHSTV